MPAFTTASSAMTPLLAADIDTDQVIPAQFVNVRGQDRLKEALFANRRRGEPDFVLNDPVMATRSIMLVGPNFGCGSSREAAAWALEAFGIRALIGTTFNETFTNNCLQNGLLPVPLSPRDHAAIEAAFRKTPEAEIRVDLNRLEVNFAGATYGFRVDPFARELLLKDQDELDYLVARRPAIEAYEVAMSGGALP